jgi:hypothetical protein
MLPPTLGYKKNKSLCHAAFLFGLLFDPDNGGAMVTRNVGCLSTALPLLMQAFQKEIYNGITSVSVWRSRR